MRNAIWLRTLLTTSATSTTAVARTHFHIHIQTNPTPHPTTAARVTRHRRCVGAATIDAQTPSVAPAAASAIAPGNVVITSK